MLTTSIELALQGHPAADLGSDSCGHLLGGERLDQVVVSAAFEAEDAVRYGTLARDQDDRQRPRTVVRADLTQDLEPVQHGHVDIKQHHRKFLVLDGLDGLDPIARQRHLEVLALQRVLQQRPDGRVVIGDEDACPIRHGVSVAATRLTLVEGPAMLAES